MKLQTALWRGNETLRHDTEPRLSLPPRTSGIDGMEVEAAAEYLRMWLSAFSPTFDKMHLIEEIIQLARSLPSRDPLVTYASHTAAIIQPLLQLGDDRVQDIVAMYCPSRPESLRERLGRTLRFGFGQAPSLSEERRLEVEKELLRLVNEMRVQRP